MLGYRPPSPEAARKFLDHFHEEALIAQAQQALALERTSYIPGESAPLSGLAEVNRDVIGIIAQRSPEQKIATVDLDATIIESWNSRPSGPMKVAPDISPWWLCRPRWTWF